MSYPFRLIFLLVTAAFALAACNKGVNTATAGDAIATSASPQASPSPSATATASPSPSPSATSRVYKDKDGLFEITFPEGYTHQETGSGVTFTSKDQGFVGAVDYGSAQGDQLNKNQLETALKKEYESRLKKVEWQQSKPQPDGSIRIDWVGQDQKGNQLDAVSFVEQHGDTIFILNLFGVNKPYQDYNKDAEAIVNSYHVKKENP